MYVWPAIGGVQPIRVRTSHALIMTVLRAVFGSGFKSILTIATTLATALRIQNMRAVGHGLPSMCTAVCVLEALFG